MRRFLEEIKEKLGTVSAAETIFGEPMEFNSVTIIPVARVFYDRNGGGEGKERRSRKSPLGYLEVKDDAVRFISLYDYMEFFALGALTGAGACLLLSLFGHSESPKKKREEPPSEPFTRILKVLGITLSLGTLAYYLSRLVPSLSSQYDAMADIDKEILAFGEDERSAGRTRFGPLDEEKERLWSTSEIVSLDESLDLDEDA